MNAQTMTHAAPGRPRQFDENKALAAIMRLFWEHGYEATGLNDIIRVTGLGKASLYATFGNKQSMYLRALAAFEADMIDEGAHILQSGDAPPIERIAAFLDAPIAALRDTGDARGCFLCNASADRAALDAETAAVVQRCYAKLASAMEQTLAGIVAPELTQRRAQMLLAVASGLRVMARTGMPIPTLEQARDDALSILRES